MAPSSPTTTATPVRANSSSRPPPSCPRGHWRAGEDEKLRQLVEKYGPQNWNSIAEKLEGRSGKSCRLRWFNQLDPRINRRPFTAAEEERLLQAHRAHGNRWALISRFFPGRTDNAVKNHWHVVMARRRRRSHHHHRFGGSGCSPPPRRPPLFQWFHFGAPPPAEISGSLCFAMPGSGPSSLGSPAGSFSVRNFNVAFSSSSRAKVAAAADDDHRRRHDMGKDDVHGGNVTLLSSSREAAAAPDDHRHDMGKAFHGGNNDGKDEAVGRGAAANRKDYVPFFDFLGVGM